MKAKLMGMWIVVVLVLIPSCGGETPKLEIIPAQHTAEADFGVVQAGVVDTETFLIQKPFLLPAKIEVIDGSPGPFTIDLDTLQGSVPYGIECEIRISCTPPDTPPSVNEPVSHVLQLRFTELNGTTSAPVTLTCRATVEAPLGAVVANTMVFENTALNQRVTRQIKIRNPNEATTLQLVSAEGGGGQFTLQTSQITLPRSLTPGAMTWIPITYHPSSLGSHEASVEIGTSVGGTKTVQVFGNCISSELVTDFGFVPVGSSGETDWIEVTVPAEGISVNLEIFGAEPGSADFWPIAVEGPGGKSYWNETSGPYEWYWAVPVGYGALFTQLPNSDDRDVRLVRGGGTYRFRLTEASSSNPGYYIRAIVEQRFAGAVGTGHLPVNVFLADGIPVALDDAPQDTKLQSVLSTMDVLFSQVGIRVGPVSYHKLSDPAFDQIDDDAEQEALLTESRVAANERLNLFFVDFIASSTPGGATLGIAGAIPGIKRNGTIYSGVLVAYSGYSGAEIGATAAHECGHYLGLFHTSQFDYQGNLLYGDPIHATPTCPLWETTPECPTIGNSNLMWPYDLGYVDGLRIDQAQGNIMLNHPLIEPGLPPGVSAKTGYPNTSAKVALDGLRTLAEWRVGCETCRRLLARKQ